LYLSMFRCQIRLLRPDGGDTRSGCGVRREDSSFGQRLSIEELGATH
jgi:hypothetical protein